MLFACELILKWDSRAWLYWNIIRVRAYTEMRFACELILKWDSRAWLYWNAIRVRVHTEMRFARTIILKCFSRVYSAIIDSSAILYWNEIRMSFKSMCFPMPKISLFAARPLIQAGTRGGDFILKYGEYSFAWGAGGENLVARWQRYQMRTP